MLRKVALWGGLFISLMWWTLPVSILAVGAWAAEVFLRKRSSKWAATLEPHRRWIVVMAVVSCLNFVVLGVGFGRSSRGGAAGKPGDMVSFAPYGAGYESYSWLGTGLLGRQYTRRDVRAIVERAFAARADDGGHHLLAETGLSSGKSLHFHASHKRGRAIDIHLPLKGWAGSAVMPSNAFTAWGYLWRFDPNGTQSAFAWDVPTGPRGRCKHNPKFGLALPVPEVYAIDFDELAHLLAAVYDADRAVKSTDLRYVILWRPYVGLLKATPTYRRLFGKGSGRRAIRFKGICAKPIHDEHIHLHFKG